jgi:hypothetical protein
VPRAKTTTDLLTAVRARVAAPTANGLLSSDELLALADEEMRSELASLLIGVRSEYWLTSTTTAVLSGTSTYRMPDDALGMTLRDVTLYDVNGSEWDLPQVPADKRYQYAQQQSDRPLAFSLENGQIVLLPAPSSSAYTMRVRYYRRPSTLDTVDNCGAIYTAASETINISALSATPPYTAAPPTVIGVGTYIDIVRGAGMFDPLESNLVVLTVGADDLDLDPTTPITSTEIASTAFGQIRRVDYVTRAGHTPYPPIPEALWPVLVSATCRAFCEAVGDSRGLEAAAAMYNRRVKTALDVLSPRVDGEPVQPLPSDTPLRGGRVRMGWR